MLENVEISDKQYKIFKGILKKRKDESFGKTSVSASTLYTSSKCVLC